MAVPTVAHNEATPAGTDYIREGDDRIREFKTQVREVIAVDHKMDSAGSGATWGMHKWITFIEAADIGSGTAGLPILGAQTIGGLPELLFKSETDESVQLTQDGHSIATETPDDTAPTEDEGIANKKYVDGHGMVQVVNTLYVTKSVHTTQIPDDDTIPQITEGEEVMTRAITPTSATNKLLIRVVVHCASGQQVGLALFQDATAGALAATFSYWITYGTQIVLDYYMDAGTVVETTFRVRIGMMGAGTVTVNGEGANRVFGGVVPCSITITEIKV